MYQFYENQSNGLGSRIRPQMGMSHIRRSVILLSTERLKILSSRILSQTLNSVQIFEKSTPYSRNTDALPHSEQPALS